jgi:hypothetical protein
MCSLNDECYFTDNEMKLGITTETSQAQIMVENIKTCKKYKSEKRMLL